MIERDAEFIGALFADAVDMVTAIEDEQWLGKVGERVSPDVTTDFLVPEQGGIEVMEQSHFVGVDGLLEGWRIWLEPWEKFQIDREEIIDVGDGQVLVTAQATGRMHDSDVEVPQRVATLQRTENGRIVSMRFYLDQEQARRDAGLA